MEDFLYFSSDKSKTISNSSAVNSNSPIGLFDSGIGGITVLDQCKKLMPYENYIYLSDTSNAPYGNKTEREISQRVDACAQQLINSGCKAVVAACNTATNVGIANLRQSYPIPFVGLEPALKPAREACGNGLILLLVTCATFKQQKFKDLMQKFGGKNVKILRQKTLATDIESHLEDTDFLRKKTEEIFEPYPHALGIVLGCTHYVFLTGHIQNYYHNSVKIFDGNVGAAMQLKRKLQGLDLLSQRTAEGEVTFISL